MIEALKEIVGIIKDLPEMALWILSGYFFYKLFIVGSVYGVIRLAIIKIHDYMVRPKEEIKKITLSEKFITSDKAYDEFLLLIDSLLAAQNSKYVHSSGVRWLKDAVKEKATKDGLPVIVTLEEFMKEAQKGPAKL